MKSRFFKDTQGLDHMVPPCDKVCVCLRLSRRSYERAMQQASRMNLTSGEYIDYLILAQPVNACGTKAQPPSDNLQKHFPPAPPGH